MADELKPCPFCGSGALHDVTKDQGIETWSIYCEAFACHGEQNDFHTSDSAIAAWNLRAPIPLVMFCPAGHQHIDEGEWKTKPHKTHECQAVVRCLCPARNHEDCVKSICGLEWRPADFPTVGVKEGA